jgi:putative ABC transport system ATP-binding protein
MNAARTLLEARDIGRLAPGSQQWLLRNASLAVRGGERLAIVGPTGAGKTLLLRALALLDPVDEGQVLWLGQPIAAERVPHYRRHVTYLHQRSPLIEGTVEENLRLPFTLAIHAREEFDRGRVVALLESAGRDAEFLTRGSRDLSGGEGQIVAVVRALQLNPTVLLLDEPTASLDAATAHSIEQLVFQWHRQSELGRAAVWVTHDREQASRIANRIIEMNSRRISRGT